MIFRLLSITCAVACLAACATAPTVQDPADPFPGPSSNSRLRTDYPEWLKGVTLSQRGEPSYPDGAYQHRISGQVALVCLVGADGSCSRIDVDASYPRGVFEQAAIDAVKKWRYALPSGWVPGPDRQIRIDVIFEYGTCGRRKPSPDAIEMVAVCTGRSLQRPF